MSSTGAWIAAVGISRLDGKLVDFAFPLGMIMYMPSGVAVLAFILWWIMCSAAGMPIPIEAVVKLLVLCIILAIAAPPIPGSAILMIPIIFSSMGIAQDYISIAIILGYLTPAFHGYCLQLELLMLGRKLAQWPQNA